MRKFDIALYTFHHICDTWENFILLASNKDLSKQERDTYIKESIIWRDRVRSSMAELEEEYQKLNPYEED